MKKDASQMKLFSWNDIFMEAYSVMPDRACSTDSSFVGAD